MGQEVVLTRRMWDRVMSAHPTGVDARGTLSRCAAADRVIVREPDGTRILVKDRYGATPRRLS